MPSLSVMQRDRCPPPVAGPATLADCPAGVTECWQHPLTGEVFLDYEAYLDRWQLYRRRQWTCTVTGKSGLTYEEALNSERKSKEELRERIPDALQRQILLAVQYNMTSRIDKLTEDIAEHMRFRFCTGETLQMALPGEKESPTIDVLVTAIGSESDNAGVPTSYRVHRLDDADAAELEVSTASLSRSRFGLPKQLLRQFIRDSATHGVTSSHDAWVVREDLAAQFGISTEMPENVRRVIEERLEAKRKRSQIEEDSDAGTKRKAKTDTGISKKIKKGKGEEVQPLPRPRYPVEDTELAIYIKPTTAPHTLTAAVPLPSKQFTVPQENIGDLLFVWNFFFKFAEPLKVSPFSLDDFENALRHNQAPACSIILETHLALLKIAVRQTAELRAKQERQLKFGPKRAAPRLSAALSTGVRASSTSVDVVGDDDEKTADDDKTDTEKANADDDDEDQDGGNDKINSLPLLPEEKWWLTKVGADNFTEIIPSFLLSTGRVDDFPNIANALEHLIQKKLVVERNSASPFFGRVFVADGSHWLSDEVDYELQYATLPIVDKLAFLRLLITDSVLHSALVRDFIEKCDAQSLELRKEKRELEQQRKELLEELAELEKKDNGLESNVSTSGDMKVSKSSKDAEEATDVDVSGFDSDGDLSIDGNNSSDVEEDDDDEEVDEDSAEWFDKQLRALQKRLNAISDEDLSRTSRQEKSKVQQQIKETEEAKRAAEIRREKALSRQKSAANKAKLAEKRVIYEGLLKLLKREAVVDRDLRSLGGGIRGRPLGRDRFWNRYWWFEGYGSGMAGVMEFNASTGYSTRGTNLIPYGTGRLWVQGVGRVPFLGQVSGGSSRQIGQRRKPGDDPKADLLVTLPQGYAGIMAADAVGENWLADGEWAVYETPEEVAALLDFLNPKGVRELALRNSIVKYRDMIEFNLKKRNAEVAALMSNAEMQQQRGRPSTRRKAAGLDEPYLQYENRWK